MIEGKEIKRRVCAVRIGFWCIFTLVCICFTTNLFSQKLIQGEELEISLTPEDEQTFIKIMDIESLDSIRFVPRQVLFSVDTYYDTKDFALLKANFILRKREIRDKKRTYILNYKRPPRFGHYIRRRDELAMFLNVTTIDSALAGLQKNALLDTVQNDLGEAVLSSLEPVIQIEQVRYRVLVLKDGVLGPFLRLSFDRVKCQNLKMLQQPFRFNEIEFSILKDEKKSYALLEKLLEYYQKDKALVLNGPSKFERAVMKFDKNISHLHRSLNEY